MREIKFRQWGASGFHYWGFLRDFFAGPNSPTGQANAMDSVHEQFTGTTDAHGREIYEGDILRGFMCDYSVRWDDGAYYAHPISFAISRWQLSGHNELDLFVIGNIHENPELLGES